MATVQSLGEYMNLNPLWSPWPDRTGVFMYDQYNRTYSEMYRSQPNIRTCVDFLSRNIAQLGLQVFRRISNTDRERLLDHPLTKLLNMPLPPVMKVTKYRHIESTMGDLGIYFNAFWLKLRQENLVTGLIRVPPEFILPEGGLIPSRYLLRMSTGNKFFPPEDIVHFKGYNPENPIAGLSPLETLRRILAEEYASGQYRQELWLNGARMKGFIKRPLNAPTWGDDARERFIAEFNQLYAGPGNGGSTAVLEEGMEWQDASFDSQETEYIQGRKLTREECARAYHIPLPMVGILDNATFSNITEQHQNLYQDSLGPWLESIQQDIELQLMTDFLNVEDVYVEFNMMEKLKGDFNEQVKTLQSAVGRPWMTADEARARMNLPSLGGDAAELVTPLNVVVGGQASPQDSTPDEFAPPPEGLPKEKKSKGISFVNNNLRNRHQQRFSATLSKHYRRQEAYLVNKVPKARKNDIGGLWWDSERWNRELSLDLFRLNGSFAMDWANRVIDAGIDVGDQVIFEQQMSQWILEHSQAQARNMNNKTMEAVAAALKLDDPNQAVKDVFEMAATTWAISEAVSMTTSIMNFGANEAAKAGRLRKKMWVVTSNNPRDSHKAINGEVVGIRDKFSNGLKWPGDPAGSGEDNANCQCVVEFL